MTRSTTGAWRVAGAGRRVATRSTQVTADPARFESVYRSCQAELYRYVLSIVRDPHAAEDVMQSAMTRAMEALVHEDRDFELRPWLFRIAHNEAISRFRRERATVELDDASLASAARTAPAASVPETAERNEAVDQLWKDLAELPERQRQALVLRELSGMGHDEIGSVLGTSGRAVKQTIFEARRGLLECSEGRAMDCTEVQQTLSDGDGRVRRSRRMRAHIADCSACAAFDAALFDRPERLAALAPALPVAVSASLLAHLFPSVHGAALASASGAGGALSTGGLSGLVMSKLAVAAAVGAVAVGGTGVAVVATRSGESTKTVEPAGPAAGSGGLGPAGGAAPAGTKSAAGITGTTPAGSTPGTTPQATTPGAEGRAAAAAARKANAATRGNSSSAPGAAVSAAARAKAQANAKSAAASGKNKSGSAKNKSSSAANKGARKPDPTREAPAKAVPPRSGGTSTKPAKADPPAAAPSSDAGASVPEAAADTSSHAESAPSTDAPDEGTTAPGGASGRQSGRTAK